MCPGPTSGVASPPAQESVSSKLHVPRLMKCIGKRRQHMEHTSHNSLPSRINVGLRYSFPFRDQINSFRSFIPELFFFFLVGFFFFFLSKNQSSWVEQQRWSKCITTHMYKWMHEYDYQVLDLLKDRVPCPSGVRAAVVVSHFAISMLLARRHSAINFKHGCVKLIEVTSKKKKRAHSVWTC